jgi:drug/metabolite transporter (DMT)-like permease
VILLVIGRINHIHGPKNAAHIPLFLLSGGMGFSLYMIFFNSGMLTLTSATSSLIIATTPVLTAIGAALLYHEKIKPVGWCAIAAAFMGVAVLLLTDTSKGGLSGGVGLFWTMAAALVFCCYNLMNRKLLSMGYTAVECVTWSMVCGALWLMPFMGQAIPQVMEAPAYSIIATAYLGAMPSATAYLLWSNAMSLAKKTSDVSNFQFLTPLLSTVMGFAMLGEVPSMMTVIGGLIIIASITVFGLKGK